jgi:hypothetical protein
MYMRSAPILDIHFRAMLQEDSGNFHAPMHRRKMQCGAFMLALGHYIRTILKKQLGDNRMSLARCRMKRSFLCIGVPSVYVL